MSNRPARKRGAVCVVNRRRAHDSAAWPHATHGFFKFKDKIPALLGTLKGIGLV
jgi:deoxyribodipyrimidine photo-lyase